MTWRACLLAVFAGPAVAIAAPAAADADAERTKPVGERLKLRTSDDVALAAWYYPVAKPEPNVAAPPPAVVILLHDLGGSHESVEPLAAALQARGIAVVAPDLRGHGASGGPGGRGDIDAKSLKRPDFEQMAITGGGQVREEALRCGDVETVRNWIKERSDAGALDIGKLFVVGVGTGAAVAAAWTVNDTLWPDLASGPQGRQVRGLVLVSPVWTTRGFTISPALALEPVRRSLPVLVIGGAGDSDAVKIYEQLKRQRPDSWNEKRAGQEKPTQAPKLDEAKDKKRDDVRPSLYLRQFAATLSGDRLAAFVPDEGSHPAVIIGGFVDAVTAVEP